MNETQIAALRLLSESWRFSEPDDTWPRLYTQKGLADAIGVQRPAVTKALKELRIFGLVDKLPGKRRVNGEKRAVTGYTITRYGADFLASVVSGTRTG